MLGGSGPPWQVVTRASHILSFKDSTIFCLTHLGVSIDFNIEIQWLLRNNVTYQACDERPVTCNIFIITSQPKFDHGTQMQGVRVENTARQ
jgi:hypothetical protein